MATSAQINAIVALYAGYFDRAPDPAGLQFWINQIDAGRDFATIAADFAAGDEAKALYPFLTAPAVASASTFVTAVYQNLFNRAPDAAGLKFWTDVITAGTVPVGDMIQSIINGAVDAATATPPTFDAAVLANKQIVGLDFATDAANKAGFVYDAAAAAAAKAAMDGVTNVAATVDAAKAATDAFLGGTGTPGVPGDILTLTKAADAITGTTGDDTIRSLTAADLTSADVIDGGAGIDTLNITLHSASAPVIKNVEIINDADATAMDLTAVSGVQQYWSTGAVGNTINNAALSTIFGTKLTGKGTVDVDILASTAGKADTLKIAAQDNTGLTTFISKADAGTIELLEVSALGNAAAGAKNDDLVDVSAFTGLTSIKVSGSGDVNVDSFTGGKGATLLTTVDASAATGAVTVDASGSTKAITATGGTGADTFVLGAGNDTADGGAGNDNITGGAGNDNLKGGAGNDTLLDGAGTDTLEGGAGQDTFTLSNDATADTIIVETTNTDLGSIDLATGFTSTSDKIEFGGAAGSATNFKADASGGAASYNDALQLANGLLDGTVIYAVVSHTASTGPVLNGTATVFYDSNADGTADMAINLNAPAVFGDII